MAYPGKEPALYQLYRHTFVSFWFDEARTKWADVCKSRHRRSIAERRGGTC